MTTGLNLGKMTNGKGFSIPSDAVAQTFGIVAIRGAGKTCTATVFAEEMARLGLPFLALDPVGVWWGLRVKPDGTPGGYPVVVVGGEHGDIPLDKGAGGKIAEAVASEPVSVIVDLSRESKRFWHTFVTDLSLGLMQCRPEVPRHIFVEEAPEFVPQRTKVDLTARCKEAVERLVRLGRNNGYGCTLVSQRPATVDKDVLSQCENLIVLRITGPHDRKAVKEWVEANASERGLEKFINSLATLESGEGWFWSPQWLKMFERIRFRPRATYHPGETRRAGVRQRAVTLSDVEDFSERLRRQISKMQVVVPDRKHETVALAPRLQEATPQVQDEVLRLKEELARERSSRVDVEKRLAAVKQATMPYYQALRGLHETIGNGTDAAPDSSVYMPWLQKAGRAGCRRLLETLIERRELTRSQLGTLAGVSALTSTFRGYMAWLKRNRLVEVDGDVIRLLVV